MSGMTSKKNQILSRFRTQLKIERIAIGQDAVSSFQRIVLCLEQVRILDNSVFAELFGIGYSNVNCSNSIMDNR